MKKTKNAAKQFVSLFKKSTRLHDLDNNIIIFSSYETV